MSTERTEIVFPVRMAILMKAARLVPVVNPEKHRRGVR